MMRSRQSFQSSAATAAAVFCLSACAGPSAEQAAPSASAGLVKIASNDPTGGVIAGGSPGVQEARQTIAVSGSDDTVAKTMALWRAVRGRMMTEPVEWANQSTGGHGSAQIIREVAIPDSDRVCREFRQSGVIGGRRYQNYGQVCQQKDGDWSLIQG